MRKQVCRVLLGCLEVAQIHYDGVHYFVYSKATRVSSRGTLLSDMRFASLEGAKEIVRQLIPFSCRSCLLIEVQSSNHYSEMKIGEKWWAGLPAKKETALDYCDR